ncbi:hypothetical protein OAG86_03090 [Akkermansiaceae bacterium]|nr:hypothetical protein [Akkermansiaceae bacterium]MDB4499133.1 hypothetical protein [Akkermansiaceae bacterium]MDB4597249.1 hypothetical protein [Akkermansiaceae bacterium]MDC1206599.1 hypothetical protein [Akkermansiaceae bacterium]
MKKLLLLLLSSSLACAQTPPSEISTDQTFSIFNGTTPENAKLSDYEGKIVILMLMTHW